MVGKNTLHRLLLKKKVEIKLRSFLTCRASDGTRWELRGYGKTVVEATADAWANFKCS